MYEIDRIGRLTSVPTVRSCPVCPWQIVSDSAVLAEMEQATHRITNHATLPERRRVQRLVASYRQILGNLPAHLLVLMVQQVMDTPATPATTPAEVVSAA